MNTEYGELAKLYDAFMEEVDYPNWAGIMCSLAGLAPGKRKVLELGCGTGSLTAEFLKAGHQVIALDISQEMLTEAENKLRKYRSQLKLVCQDMREMEVGSGFDVCFCGCDGFNYILDTKELLQVFKACHKALLPGGSLVFDLSSLWKLENVLGNNCFREERSSCEIFWMNRFDPETSQVEMELVFLVPEGTRADGVTLYRKFEEFHVQRAYTPDEIERMLSYEGFEEIRIFGSDGTGAPREKDERIFVSCRKK